MTKNILILGAGYVGLAHAAIFGKSFGCEVVIADVDKEKISLINQGVSPIKDDDIQEVFESYRDNIKAVHVDQLYFAPFDYIFLCLPTNYDEEQNSFDTAILNEYLKYLSVDASADAKIIIKSTVPMGYTSQKIKELNDKNIIFSPEFLREGRALRDLECPKRLILGTELDDVNDIVELYAMAVDPHYNPFPVLIVRPDEAEATKLFANAYLAMRVAFFNELDGFCESWGLSSRLIIEGMSFDERIGNLYNNPSFGYGGYCLPKDTKQLAGQFEGSPSDLISAIVDSNASRKDFIVKQVEDKNLTTIGVFGLSMKKDSDNHRESAILDIINNLKSKGMRVLIYEKGLTQLDGFEVIDDLKRFKEASELILANRMDIDLVDVVDKVYTRDIYDRD